MKNILFYDAYAKDDIIGGSCIALKRLFKYKKKEDLQYYFLVNQLNEKYYSDNISSLKVKSFYVRFPALLFQYNKRYVRGIIAQILLFLFIILPLNIKLAYEFRKSGIDKVVCNEVRAALTIGIAARLAGIPLITFVRGDSLIDHYLTRISMLMSNKIICISEGIYNLAYADLKEKAVVINDGIEYMEVQRCIQADIINILNVAYVTPAKGQLILLHAIKLLVKRYDNIKCYFIGAVADKNYYNLLLDYIACNGLEKHVTFTGFVKDVNKYLSQGSIYVQPSLTEGMPLSILEAYMFELPVVASNLPGLTPVVKHGLTGLIFEKQDHIGLADCILKLIENSNLADFLGCNGKDLVKNKYAIDTIVQQFEEYITK
jgi:glycosyltransferase involved in cell wall biosynthesis